MKNIKNIAFIILGILVLGTIFYAAFYRYNKLKQNTVDQKISRYIEENCPDLKICYAVNNCPEEKQCRVTISKFTDFDWDTFCAVDSGATLNYKPDIIPATLPNKYSLNNPKFIFLLEGKIVLFEEIPVGIENIPSGTVLVDTKKYCFDKEEAVFNVKKIENGLRGIYNLFRENEKSTND